MASLKDFVSKMDQIIQSNFSAVSIIIAMIVESGSYAGVVDGGNFCSSVDNKVFNIHSFASGGLNGSLDQFALSHMWQSLIDLQTLGLGNWVVLGII